MKQGTSNTDTQEQDDEQVNIQSGYRSFSGQEKNHGGSNEKRKICQSVHRLSPETRANSFAIDIDGLSHFVIEFALLPILSEYLEQTCGCFIITIPLFFDNTNSSF